MLLIFFGSVALVAVITLAVIRFLIRISGTKQLFEEGVVLTENGIEFLGLFWLGRRKATFSEIESVKLIPFYKVMLSYLFLRYGLSVHTIRTHFFSEFVEIKLKKSPSFWKYQFEYLLCTPKNPSAFVEQLKSRIC